MKLAELRRKARTITLQWPITPTETAPIQITYDPSKITMASQDIPDDGKTLHDYWQEKLQEYVTSWDIQDEDGKNLAVTAEGIAKLEVAMVQFMLSGIQDDARPNRMTTTST